MEERIKLLRRIGYLLMGVGYYGLNGVGSEVGRYLWFIYVVFRMFYGLEGLLLILVEFEVLEEYLRVIFRVL